VEIDVVVTISSADAAPEGERPLLDRSALPQWLKQRREEIEASVRDWSARHRTVAEVVVAGNAR
jgi:hypothetical protein